VKSHNSSIGRLRDDIDNWDTRLDVRRAALERQFSALEVSLGTLQNQGNWLAGQLSGLPKWS
jgi:flagellar hook-associated protein 2